MANTTRVGIETVFEFIGPDGRPAPVPVELGYRADEPHAVSMTFRMADQATVWLVSRDLLADGLVAATGEGDVRLRPFTARAAILELYSDDEHAVFHVPVGSLQAFLNSSYDVVAPGREGDFLDIDSALRGLFAE
ncbi:sporulation protein SsgA [Lentzea sp. NBRC 105346]|uniref:SsgA family sporulation/cell division regulator n=1 Tax=Lentzea sp. NBRC 105346 TaxID=3032205 RepID=UPI0024A533F5|nr:SsgA family sporulation/cell division regulator [Lentzea sp. NBRC 105346]GLZ33771.1 sporulation protein SsgA [Lentzea sp. NBRC 105346]